MSSFSSPRDHHAAGRPRKRRKAAVQEVVKVSWSDEEGEDVGTAAYNKFKAKKPGEKKRAAAETRKVKAKVSTAASRTGSGSTAVGLQPNRKVKRRHIHNESSSDCDGMEESLPDYIRERRAAFNMRREKLKDGGLRLPPRHDEVNFSDDEDDRLKTLKEKPDFAGMQPIAPYQDVHLPQSMGLIPASIAQYLRDYQVKGAEFLHRLFVFQKGGILGDDMGLGKTIQVIAFLTAAFGKTGDERDRKRMRKMRRDGKWYPKILIICPGSLMANWQDELERWGWWTVELYHGSDKRTVLEAANAGMVEIMITTYTTYRIRKNDINVVAWDCVVADECHIIKGHRSEISLGILEINALCRIGLTGTAIQNKYEELWTLLNWTNPGVLGPRSIWKVTICEPLKLGQSHNATNYELAKARTTAENLVQNLLPRFFLRRTKALIKDQLPKKTDRVVFCPLTERQADAYQNFLDSEFVSLIKYSNEICPCGSKKKQGWCCRMFLEDSTRWQHMVFPAMQTLQKLSNHVALLIPQGNDSTDRQGKDLDYLQIAVPGEWKHLYANRDSLVTYSNPEFCGKWKILRKLLKFWHDQGDNKVLVFSHSVRLLKMLKALLDVTAFQVAYLDGGMSYEDRYRAVQEFNSDSTQFVFLISTRAGGVGLNITSANKVVVVDPNWNPSYDLQAQDRAYRIGQTRDVEVFRLVSQGTLEEIIYARQIYKQQQANIGYTNSTERRYFQGVMDKKEQKGELFGLQNLFAFQNENVVLRDIVNKTNVAESKAGIRVANLGVETTSKGSQSEEDCETDDDASDAGGTSIGRSRISQKSEDSAMSQMAAEITGELDTNVQRKAKGRLAYAASLRDGGSTVASNKRRDPVQAILSSMGVSYTHENSEVIGSSTVEAQLSKHARNAADRINETLDLREQQAKAFLDESHLQTQGPKGQQVNYSPSVQVGEGSRPSIQHFGRNHTRHETHCLQHYRYRPPEAVKRRQFCAMASAFGYGEELEGVTEFASMVENWTQSQRRECLDKFYQWRKELLRNHDGIANGRGSEQPKQNTNENGDQAITVVQNRRSDVEDTQEEKDGNGDDGGGDDDDDDDNDEL